MFIYNNNQQEIPENTKHLIIEGFQQLQPRQFVDLTNIEILELREPLQVIPRFCFAGLSNLKHIIFPSTLTEIKQLGFLNCFNIETVENLENTQIEYFDSPFNTHKIHSLILPPTITTATFSKTKFNKILSYNGKHYFSNTDKSFELNENLKSIRYFNSLKFYQNKKSLKTKINDLKVLYVPSTIKSLVVDNNKLLVYVDIWCDCEINNNINLKRIHCKKINDNAFKTNPNLEFVLSEENKTFDTVIFKDCKIKVFRGDKIINGKEISTNYTLNKYVDDFHIKNSDLFEELLENENVNSKDLYEFDFGFDNALNVKDVFGILNLYREKSNFETSDDFEKLNDKLETYYLNISKLRCTNLINLMKKIIDCAFKDEYTISFNSLIDKYAFDKKINCTSLQTIDFNNKQCKNDEEIINLKFKNFEGQYNSNKIIKKLFDEYYCYNTKSLIHCIDNSGFFSMINLKELVLSDDIMKIKSRAFINCKNLETVILGHFVKSIGKGAFASCGKLKNINLENIIVETEIKDDAFLYCRELENVILPKHLKELNKRVFAYCSKLNNVKFNDELKKIGMLAFVYCKSLKSVEFPESLEEMADDSFKDTLIML